MIGFFYDMSQIHNGKEGFVGVHFHPLGSPNLESILVTPEIINEIIKTEVKYSSLDTNKISDGYHTFGELYDHRIANFILAAREIAHNPNRHHSHPVWRSKKHSDGELAFGGTWFVLGICKEAGKQITYHLPISQWDEAWFAVEQETAPEWDGHTSEDVLERLKTL